VGLDPARFGDDRFSLAWRQGRKVIEVQSKSKLDVVQGANWIRSGDRQTTQEGVRGHGRPGAGTVDILHSWGAPYDKIVVA
jgi:hypothetical protein